MSELDILPRPTRQTWQQIAPIIPPQAYLMGGTALAVRLRHRESHDLDFFLEAPANLQSLADQLAVLAPTVIQTLTASTLNCLFAGTRLQFLEASNQRLVGQLDMIAGVRVGSLPDLLTTKLLAITSRPAIRDYVDLWALETIEGLHVEEGLAFVEQRYPEAKQAQTWRTILMALGSFDDVRDDPMPRMRGRRVTARQIENYWARRVPEIMRHMADI
jgi:hypothetical protein